jgi:hypothetical protein
LLFKDSSAHCSQIEEERIHFSLRSLRLLVWLYFWLLLWEGALRKWFFPSPSTPLLVVRDPVVLVIYAIAGAQMTAVGGCVRPAGIFSFVTSMVSFLSVVAAVLLSGFLDQKQLPRWLCVAGIPALLLSLALSGRRSAIARRCWAAVARGQALPFLLIASNGLDLVSDQFGQPTTLGFAVLFSGLALAAIDDSVPEVDLQVPRKPRVRGRAPVAEAIFRGVRSEDAPGTVALEMRPYGIFGPVGAKNRW